MVAELAKELKELRAKEGHELIYVLDREHASITSLAELSPVTDRFITFGLSVQLSSVTTAHSTSPRV